MSTQENLFQSIDYIIEARMSEIAKDITELCTVVKVYDEKDNKPNTYYVSNGQLKFDAIAQGDDVRYSKDAQVYVLIPNGDYSGNKLILGSYKTEDPYKYKYITPEDEILKAYALGTSVLKNSILYKSLTIPRVGFGDEFTHMLFTFNLSTYGFDNYTGQYTLDFVLADHELNKDGEYIDTNGEVLEDQTAAKTYGLSIPHTELYGNPYEYDPNYPISYIIPIYKIIEKDPEFRLYNIKSIKYAINQADNTGTIVLHNCQISLGYAAKDFANETTQIRLLLDSPMTTPNTVMEKDSAFEYSANVSKDMSFDLGIVENNILSIYNEQNVYANSYKAYWCQYNKDHQKQVDQGDIPESGTHWKTIAYDFLSKSNTFQYKDFKPNSEWDEDRIKVIVRYEGILKEGKQRPYWESNILVFRNLANAPSQGANNANVSPDILLQLADNDDGNYNIYGTDHRLVSYAKKNQNTTVTVASFFDGSLVDNSYIFTWKIPYSNSMIKPPKLDTDWEPDNKDNPKFWIKTNRVNTDIALSTIQYDFSDLYYSNKIHNTIYCEIQKTESGKIYYGSIDLTFGLTNTNGSGYALNIVPNHYYGLSHEDSTGITYTATLENADGQEISYDSKNLVWSWYYGDKELAGLTLTANGTTCTVKRTIPDLEFNSRARAILKVTLNNWTDISGKKINLTAAYPIGMGYNKGYITGAARIMYDHTGRLSSYDDTPYQLIYTTNDQPPITKWEIVSQDATAKLNCPTIDNNHKLIPLPQLPAKITPCYVRLADDTTGRWFQPLLIEQDTYASALLNEWDGKLAIKETEDGNGNVIGSYILTNTIGAGIKETDNTYTGILMGQIQLQNERPKWGVYGFDQGQLRFQLGEIKKANSNEYIHGLDIYEGALRVYTKDDNIKPALWVEESNIYLKGRITNQYSQNGQPTDWMTMGNPDSTEGEEDRGPAFRIYHSNVLSTLPVFKIWPGYVNGAYSRVVVSGYKSIGFSPYVQPNTDTGYTSYLTVDDGGGSMKGAWNYNTLSGGNITSTGTITFGNSNQSTIYKSSTHSLTFTATNDIDIIPSKHLYLKSGSGSSIFLQVNNTTRLSATSDGGSLSGTWSYSTLSGNNITASKLTAQSTGGNLSGTWTYQGYPIVVGEAGTSTSIDDIRYSVRGISYSPGLNILHLSCRDTENKQKYYHIQLPN